MSDNPTPTPTVKWLTIIARIAVGGIFVGSGCAKMIDLWGVTFKIQEYLAVWHYNVPQPLVVTAAALLSLIEFTSGTALLLGCYRKISLLVVSAMMAVMLPLTVYIAIADPVADCGCFGEWMVISNTATLLKNILLTAIIAWLWIVNYRVRSLIVPSLQWLSTTLSVLYMIVVGIVGYTVQPLVDFRPYPPGTVLTDDMTDDMTEMVFIYEKDGKREEFTADTLPDDSWTFVDRIDSNASTADHVSTFVTYDTDGERYTIAELADIYSRMLIVLIPDISDTDPSMTFTINELDDAITAAGGTMIAIVGNDGDNTERRWRDFSLASYPVYTADATDIKIMGRGTVALVMTDNAHILWKRTLNSIDPDVISSEKAESLMLNELQPIGARFFTWLTLIFAASQLLLVAWSIFSYKHIKPQI